MTTESLQQNAVEIKKDGQAIKNSSVIQKGIIYITFTFLVFVVTIYVML